MTHWAESPIFKRSSYDYFDIVVVVWLIIGLFRGRKRGLSQEMLPTFQWIAIVALAGLFYRPFSAMIRDNTGNAFSLLWSNIIAYSLIGLGVHLLFLTIKKTAGEKLVGSDLFGQSEYYLGMASGVVRFGCMLVVFCALMNSRLVTKAERDSTEKMQKQNFEEIRFPTYGSVQQSVLFESFSGRLIETNLSRVLIASVVPDKSKHNSFAGRGDEALSAILDSQKKK